MGGQHPSTITYLAEFLCDFFEKPDEGLRVAANGFHLVGRQMICLELERTLIFHQQKAATKTGDFLKNAFLASDYQA